MEFLGDAVLSLIVSEHLMRTCPDSTEGDLSRLRAAVVSEPALAVIGRTLALGAYLLLGKGEEQTGGRDKDSLLADALEALIAALYLDAGKDVAEAFILRFFEDVIKKTCASRTSLDYKTALQERCQERLKPLPEYRVVSESGPDHQKQFDSGTAGQGAALRPRNRQEQKGSRAESCEGSASKDWVARSQEAGVRRNREFSCFFLFAPGF